MREQYLDQLHVGVCLKNEGEGHEKKVPAEASARVEDVGAHVNPKSKSND